MTYQKYKICTDDRAMCDDVKLFFINLSIKLLIYKILNFEKLIYFIKF